MALPAAAATIVEHTFVVSQMNMTHLCKETVLTVVNGQFPGPMLEVTEGDSVVINVVNMSPYNITIHWHGVKQRLSCWSDGVPMITQCPIRPGHNFTYQFKVDGQEGTLWWHAHVGCLRATLHGALIIRPRHGAASYPFPKPHREIPIVIGEWWETDLVQLERSLTHGDFDYYPSAATLNGKLGDLYDCSGAMEEGYVLEVESDKTYLLRFINAALLSEYYLKIAGHKFTVVAADANYVNPYTTDVIAIAPGETVDALLVADAPPGRYYMVALANQPTIINPPPPKTITRGIVQYKSSNGAMGVRRSPSYEEEQAPSNDVPLPAMAPEMPGLHDMVTSFDFHGNLTGLRHSRGPSVPTHVDERLFITLSAGSICRQGKSCARTDTETIIVVTMNNVSFQHPMDARTSLLEAHYNYHGSDWGGDMDLDTLPDRPPMPFNFTDRALIPYGPKEERLEPTEKATTARRFRHGSTVEVVFQNTAVMQTDYNPMHLHGHNMFVVAQGLGNYDAARDVAQYNLVNPPVRNTVLVPSLGWAAVRFVANNPGMYIGIYSLHPQYNNF
ncbi:Laccase-15 [Dichanthelium oligosanthes]|uniref:laccase n=1 Tax=Dichanthelium oligosanthes TaxID=888268 RepID=A0A1E5W3F6_9POAL|nr:Laccase-15 [Dichanthelium oligosanthes]